MKKMLLVLIVVMFGFISCSEVEHTLKSVKSDTVGLDRNIYVSMDDGTIFVYSGDGIRVVSTEYGNKVILQIDGKRLVIYNASVIVEEKGLKPTAVFRPGELADMK